MSIRLSPTAYRIVCGIGVSGVGRPSARRSGGRRRRRSRRTALAAAVRWRCARRCGGGRPRSAGAATRGTGSRSAPPVRRGRARACHPRAGRAPPPPRRHGHGPGRAWLAMSRCRSLAGRLPGRPGSRPARSRSPVRPGARLPGVPARHRRRRRPSCAPTTPGSGRRTPRPSSLAHAPMLNKERRRCRTPAAGGQRSERKVVTAGHYRPLRRRSGPVCNVGWGGRGLVGSGAWPEPNLS
jgi:hypothetical protein